MGGYLHWKSCFLKGWSRRIPVPCLSSAEAELFILVEGLKESVGVSLLLESMLQGQPPKDDYGFYQTTEGSCKIVLRTDSQAAKQISMMHGLLRGVCVCVRNLEFYTASGRLEIEFVPGS